MDEISIGDGEEQRHVTIQSGNLFDVLLEEEPDSGYKWQMQRGLGGCIRVRTDEYEEQANGGRRRFMLQAARAGECTIDFSLSRLLDADRPKRRVQVVVTII